MGTRHSRIPQYATCINTTGVRTSSTTGTAINCSATTPYLPGQPDAPQYMLRDSSTEADLTGSSDAARWIVELSNVWRAQFDSRPVTWNESAARRANDHVQTCRWEHWGSDNLAEHYSTDPEARWAVNEYIAMWASEWAYYPGFLNSTSEDYSHFTAMTWDASDTVGCAWNTQCGGVAGATTAGKGWESDSFFVCVYHPGGNVLFLNEPGRLFQENVKDWFGWRTKGEIPATTPAGVTVDVTDPNWV